MPQPTQRSFTSGELSPALRARVDLAKYQTGLALCENFIVRAQGGVYSRSGLKFIGEVDDHARVAKLIPFSFNTLQTYMLVFEHLKLRVIRNGGYVLVGAGPAIFELATPYTEAQLFRLGYTQSADVMTITHPDHDPRDLSRLADDNWTLTVNDYSPTVNPPNFPLEFPWVISSITAGNPGTVTTVLPHNLADDDLVEISGVTNPTTPDDVEGIHIANVTGANTFQLIGVNTSTTPVLPNDGTATKRLPGVVVGAGAGSNTKSYYYVVTSVDADGVESLPSVETSIVTNSLSTTAGVRLVWEPVAGADYYRIYKNTSGSRSYGWIGDSKGITFDDFNIAPLTSDSPPSDRQPFTGAGNKPSTVEYHDQRQIFANTQNEPQALYGTQVGNFKSLRTSNPARDDDAITFTIVAKQVNEIRHLLSLGSLILLTSGGEWKGNDNEEQPLVPSNAGAKIQSYNGASWVKPVIVNSTVLYLQEKNSRIRDLQYQFNSDKYTGNDLSIMSEHLFEGHQIVDMAYADEPYGIVWCVRNDGVLLGLTYLREHEVWGWHQHTTNGEFESVSVISEDNRDAVYVTVKRIINGQTKRYVERLEERETTILEDCFYVDSGLTYSGSPATVISGLDHLEGESVAILADGYEVTGKTVSSGSITLDRAASKVHVGLPYTPVIETLDIDTPSESIKELSVSVSKVFLHVEKSRGGFVGAKQDVDSGESVLFREIAPRNELDGYDPSPLKTKKVEVIIDPIWGESGGIRIEQRSPLPLAILAITPRVDIGGS